MKDARSACAFETIDDRFQRDSWIPNFSKSPSAVFLVDLKEVKFIILQWLRIEVLSLKFGGKSPFLPLQVLVLAVHARCS